jgi:multicomponent Na+:H+ antiporter subunit B
VISEYPGQVVRIICVLLAPLIMMFGIYVIAHGHYGPGGGFAGGIVVGVGIILLRITTGPETSRKWFPPIAGPAAGALGVLGFIATGALSVIGGDAYLDYAGVDWFGLEAVDRRYLGILVVEVFVGIAVAGVMLTLFDALADQEGPDETVPESTVATESGDQNR